MRKYATLHDIKLDALEELIEELGDAQLIVAYEFQSDLDRIKQRFGDVAVLLSGMPKPKRAAIMAAWNSGELKTLYLHPAAAGHGLNLQGSNAQHICWFSATWNLELYEQTIARLLRQGNQAKSVINHVLAMADTIDDLKLAALCDKDAAQDRLLQRLKAELGVTTGEETMAIRKLGQPREAEQAVQTKSVQQGVAYQSGSQDHRVTIREMATAGAKSAFSADIQAKLGVTGEEKQKTAKPTQASVSVTKPESQLVNDVIETGKNLANQTTNCGEARLGSTVGAGKHTAESGATPKERLDAIVDMFRAALESVMRV